MLIWSRVFGAEDRPIPDITIANLPRAHISFAADGSAKASASELVLAKPKPNKDKGKASASELELDNRAYERPLSKREKAAVSTCTDQDPRMQLTLAT